MCIPLAILFPETSFHLVDSIGKKIKVAQEVSTAIELKNTSFLHDRIENEKKQFDFVISRAVMPLQDLVQLCKKNIKKTQQNALPNGLICLKGGELEQEIRPFKKTASLYELTEFFDEDFFKLKRAIYIPL